MTLLEYLKDMKAVKASKVVGPNGAFISATTAKGDTFTLPVGKKSQQGKLADYQIFEAEDGGIIATVNNYSTEETLEL